MRNVKLFLILFNWNITFPINYIAVDREYAKFINNFHYASPMKKRNRNFMKLYASVFNCLDSMPLLSIEDPTYLLRFFKAPLSCLGLARWLPINAGDVARKFIRDPNFKIY